ncbi:MAG: holin [Pseudonocardiaceae bacterium]
MFTSQFWLLSLERAIKTFAQSLLAILSANGIELLEVSWGSALATAGAAALLSVLMSMTSAPVGEPNSPNLLPTAPQPTAPAAGQASVTASQAERSLA